MMPRSEELGERVRPVEEVADPYSPVPEKSKFERRLEAAKNPRWRKHKVREKHEAAEREARLAVRRKYYGAEQAKRDERNAAIRAAVPPPENRMPSAAELLDAYSRRHESEEAKLRFGRLMIDLEEYVRCQVVREGTRIVGTTGGVQEWLERNCPELAKHYHTCQRFKRKVQEDPALSERRD